MIVLFISSADTIKAVAQPARKGIKLLNRWVISSAKTTDANMARDAPAKQLAMPTSAARRGSSPVPGAMMFISWPVKTPMAPPMVKSGSVDWICPLSRIILPALEME